MPIVCSGYKEAEEEHGPTRELQLGHTGQYI